MDSSDHTNKTTDLPEELQSDVQTGKPITPSEDVLAQTQFPIVEKSLFYSVRNNIQVLSNIIYPVMGPAIRKAIQEAMKKLVQSVNASTSKSFSPESIKWRLQSIFSGRSYGEIVLKNAFIYRVDHVFLIHKETGLLLKQVSHAESIEQNSDMISAMLTAIRDFVRDSFQADESDELQEIQVGSQSVWIEGSPYAILAAVIQGEAPQDLRDIMNDTLETIQKKFQKPLTDFDGDTLPFDETKTLLEKCLLSREKKGKSAGDEIESKANSRLGEKQKGVQPLTVMGIIIGVLIIGMLVNHGIKGFHWNRFVDQLNKAPGIVVIDEDRRGRNFTATLLVDEFAGNPAQWATHYHIKAKRIRINQIPFVSADPDILEKRIRAQFSIPANVSVERNDTSLIIAGAAPWDWLMWFRQRSDLLQSSVPVDLSGLYSQEETLINEIRQEVYDASFSFITGTSELFKEDSTQVDQLCQHLAWLDRISQKLNLQWTLSVVGLTDSTANLESNIRLSLRRTKLFVAQLLPKDLETISYREFWSARRDTLPLANQQKDVIFMLTETKPYD